MADNFETAIEEPSGAQGEELDIQIGDAPVETKPDVVTLSPSEFAALKAQGDSAQAIQKGIEGLSSKLGYQAQTQQPVNAPTQTPEEFYAEHADDMFDKEKAPKVMAQYNKMLMEREYGPLFNAQAAALVSTKKELLESRDPLFKKYKSEVEQLVKSQPANVQLNPAIYDQAWEVVKKNHQSEIEEESVSAKVNAAVEAKLKELGIDPSKLKADQRPPAYENSASRSSGSAPSSGKRTVRLPDEATRAKFEREAAKRGLDLADYLRIKGY
jgi:hypothetical protein